jgi:hypothetical protein
LSVTTALRLWFTAKHLTSYFLLSGRIYTFGENLSIHDIIREKLGLEKSKVRHFMSVAGW